MKFSVFNDNYKDTYDDVYYKRWTKIHIRNLIVQSVFAKSNIYVLDVLHDNEELFFREELLYRQGVLDVIHDNEEVLIDRGLLDPSQRFYIP